MNEFNV